MQCGGGAMEDPSSRPNPNMLLHCQQHVNIALILNPLCTANNTPFVSRVSSNQLPPTHVLQRMAVRGCNHPRPADPPLLPIRSPSCDRNPLPTASGASPSVPHATRRP